MDLQEARDRHSMLEAALKRARRAKVMPNGGDDQIWSELFGRRRAGIFADSVRWTLRLEHMCLMRQASGIPAVFAFAAAGDQLAMLAKRVPALLLDGPEQRVAFERAWDEFDRRRLAARQIAGGYGCGEGDSWEVLLNINAERHAYKVELEVQRIAEMAGQMMTAFRYNGLRRECDLPQVIKDVKVGRHLDRLLPSEVAQLGGDPDLSDLALLRLVEGKALEYGMTGWDHRVRGPLVLAVDESSSMDGEPNTWAKAVALVLARIAHAEGRVVSVVHFACATAISRCMPGDELAKYRMTRHWLGGGTDIVRALRVANKEVRELGHRGHPGGDIVLISDGMEYNYQGQEAALDEAQKVGTRLWSIAIDSEFPSDAPVRMRAELYQHVSSSGLTADAVTGFKPAALAK